MMGVGALSSYSNRLRCNTRSSTETEVTTVDRYMPEVLWTMYFLRAQGFPVKMSRIAQDNEAAQLLETKGRFSSTSRTKHFKNKLFFVKDQVDQGEIAVVDCPTDKMWADFMSKAQQGRQFKVMRGQLMGCDEEYVDPLDPSPKSNEHIDTPKTRTPRIGSPAQECVGLHPRGGSAIRKARQRFGEKSPDRRVRFGSGSGDSQIAKRGRLWSDIVANRGRTHEQAGQ